MAPVIATTRADLVARKGDVLRRIGHSRDELYELVRTTAATGDEIDALDELDEIDFLLGDDV